MQQRFSPFQLILFLFVLGCLLIFIQLGILTIAFDKLGLSLTEAYFLLLCSLFGSLINLPLFTVRAVAPMKKIPMSMWRLLRMNHLVFEGKTTIAINVGGCLIPLGFSLYLFITFFVFRPPPYVFNQAFNRQGICSQRSGNP